LHMFPDPATTDKCHECSQADINPVFHDKSLNAGCQDIDTVISVVNLLMIMKNLT
jgi:hypothetical protein